ncbi:MAG: hypothetical protein GXP26_04190 [Planctomycetes bacterium]|nr:hypothetical protein [Planctomycetota bacterium]
MFYRWNHLSGVTAPWAASLIALTLVANTWALDECRQPTPSPCGADGVCRPQAHSWGYSQTRWRHWPGEEKQPGAGPETVDPDDDLMKLEPFIHPEPVEEDLRGPAKIKSNKSKREAGTEEEAEEKMELPQLEEPFQLEEKVEQPQLEEEALPDFELQGYQEVMPIPTDDMPPALPKSLRLVSGQRPLRAAKATRSGQSARPAHVRVATSRRRPVVRANASVSRQLQLVNPAATDLAPENRAEKAVYFETGDLPPSFSGK